MKKFLLVLGSWAMMLAGTAAFTSCGDDDDDNGKGGGGDTYTEYFEKNNFNGAVIVGDDILYRNSLGNGYEQLIVYQFDGDKFVNALSYLDMGTEAAAKQAAESSSEATSKGKWLVTTLSQEYSKAFDGITKQEYCDILNSANY